MSFPFHRIGVDPGVMLHNDLEDLAAPITLGSVAGYSLIRDENMAEIAEKNLFRYFHRKRFSEGIKVKSVLATISQPDFPESWKTAEGRIVLNGHAGSRAIHDYRNEGENKPRADKIFTDAFKLAMTNAARLEIFPRKCRIFSVEIKNLFNFYHLMIDTLHQLMLVPDDATVVNIVSRDDAPKPFVEQWIQQIFPELVEKVRFVHPRDLAGTELTLTPVSGEHLLYQVKGAHIDLINERAPRDGWWKGYDAARHHVATLKLNSVDSSLFDFQQRAIERASEGSYVSDLPLIYVARKPGFSRERKMKGEDKLFAILQDMGFVKVFLEDLEPLAQVALMNSAKCVVIQHGAGLSNMIFGNPYTHFIEIGTAQTASRRWTEFIPLAHVGQCHYHAVFVDMDFPEKAGMPVFSENGLVAPKLNKQSIQKIVEIVESCVNEDMRGSVAGMVHHAERIQGTQPKAMLWRILKEQVSELD